MRHLSIGFPSKVKVVSGGEKSGTVKFVNNDGAEYRVELVDEGEYIDPNSSLYIETSAGVTSGQHRVRDPRSGLAAMPGRFSEGLEVLYSFGLHTEPPGMLGMTGQSTKGVKEYYPIKFFNSLGNQISPTYQNSELVSYREGLYLLLERSKVIAGNPPTIETKIEVYKSINGTDFYHHYEFPKHPRKGLENISGVDTKASVAAVEHDGALIVAYRCIIDDKAFLAVYKSEDEDVLDWQEISMIEVLETSVLTSEFKLRIASGNGVIMLAYCSNTKLTISAPPPILDWVNKSDFRYYVSHDGGGTFIDPESEFQKVAADAGRVGGERITSLVPFFRDVDAFPMSIYGYINQEPMSTGFDLYFDKDMGAFVILKPSDSVERMDSQGRLGNGKLIGIKTLPGDVYNWEKCLELRMDRKITGLQTDYRGDLIRFEPDWNSGSGNDTFPSFDPPFGSNPENKPFGWGNWLGYVVTDVRVVPGETKNDLILRVTQDTTYMPGVETGIAIGEFRFVDAGLLPPGEVNIAYGAKTHDEYAFVSTIMNHRLSGLLHRGLPSVINENDNSGNPYFQSSLPVTSVRHRGELLVQTAPALPAAYGAKLGPFSNIGETKGYELSYPGRRGDVKTVGAVLEGGAVQRVDHVEAKGVGSSSIPPAFVKLYDNQAFDPEDPFPYKSLLRFIALTREKFIKVKFKIQLDSNVPLGSSGEFVFFDMLLSGDRQTPVTDLRVALSAEKVAGRDGRNIKLYYEEELFYLTTMTDGLGNPVFLDLSRETEFLVANVSVVGPSGKGTEFLLFYRQDGDKDWRLGIREGKLVGEIDPPKPLIERKSFIKIGFVESLKAGTYDDNVKVGDFAVSSLGVGAKPVYTDIANANDRFETEPFAKVRMINDGSIPDKYLANPIKLFDRTMPVLNRANVQLIGGSIENSKTSLFTLSNGARRNLEETVIDGVADSVYDFTERWMEDPDFEIIIREMDEDLADVLTLVNLNGVISVEVKAGFWHEEYKVWMSSRSQVYHVPMIDVDVAAIDGRNILVTGAELEPGQVTGSSFFSYNVDSKVWDTGRVIVDNIGDVLKLDLPISSEEGKKKFFIAKNIMSFDISDISTPVSSGYYPTHFGFKFNSADDATFRAVGEISIGRWVDLSSHIIESSSKTKDNTGIVNSDFGSLYPSLVKKGNVVDEIDLSFPYLRADNGEADSVRDMLLSLRRTRRAFPFIEHHTDGQKVQYVVFNDKIEVSKEGYGEKIGASLVSQSWYPRPSYKVPDVDYSFVLEVEHDDPVEPGDVVSFSISFVDPFVTVGSNTVLWRVDKDVEIRNQALTVNYAYTSGGGRVVMVRIVSPDGRVLALKRVSVFIEGAS